MKAILERLDDVGWSTCRGGWVARCPACGADGRTLTITLHHGVGVGGCLNGCLYSAVQAAFDARAARPVAAVPNLVGYEPLEPQLSGRVGRP